MRKSRQIKNAPGWKSGVGKKKREEEVCIFLFFFFLTSSSGSYIYGTVHYVSSRERELDRSSHCVNFFLLLSVYLFSTLSRVFLILIPPFFDISDLFAQSEPTRQKTSGVKKIF